MALLPVRHPEGGVVGEGGVSHADVDVGEALLAVVGVALARRDGHHLARPVVHLDAVVQLEHTHAAGAVHQLPVLVAVPLDLKGPGVLPYKQDVVHPFSSSSACDGNHYTRGRDGLQCRRGKPAETGD